MEHVHCELAELKF